ncbi:MAG: type II toxin-antitoxin system Phd/YefM family antitoxin [Nitrospinae bacterium]|nr:type II toxin-antitoxin system Phd/YefM family antitoxin [Nitrospinota bacterium]
MESVNIHEAKTKLSSLLAKVEKGNEHITICRAGQPIAEIVPYKKKKRSSIVNSLKPLKISGDLTAPSSGDWNV